MTGNFNFISIAFQFHFSSIFNFIFLVFSISFFQYFQFISMIFSTYSDGIFFGISKYFVTCNASLHIVMGVPLWQRWTSVGWAHLRCVDGLLWAIARRYHHCKPAIGGPRHGYRKLFSTALQPASTCLRLGQLCNH